VVRTTTVTTVVASNAHLAPTTSRHATTHRATAARRPPAALRPKSQVTSVAFPLSLPRDLLLLPHVGTDSRGGGVLLLLSAAAMGVLTLASLSLLRRLRRLEPR
jgi:hypothetical protein